MTATDTVTTQARETALRFVDAFNLRDTETLGDLVAEDAELRTMDGTALRGHDGLRAVLRAAEDFDLRLVPFRMPTIEAGDDGTVHIAVPIRELIGPDDIERSAQFDIRDGRIVAFAVRPFDETGRFG